MSMFRDFISNIKNRFVGRSNSCWRSLEAEGGWTKEYRKKLLEDIKGAKKSGDTKPRILVWGPVSSGKSSFYNSIAIVEGHFVNVTHAGYSPNNKSLTNKLYFIQLDGTVIENFYMMDVMGLESGNLEGLNDGDVNFLMAGQIKENYKFKEKTPISKEAEHFHAEPSLAEKAVCNVFMISAHDVDTGSLSEILIAKLLKVKDLAVDENVPIMLVLTKIDEVCEDVAGNVNKAYTSDKIRSVVSKASQKFGIPEMDIFPVKNYSNEVELKIDMDILLLLAVRHMVRYASHKLLRSLKRQQELKSTT